MNGLFNRLCWGPSWLESHAYVLHFRWGEFIRASFHNRQIYGYFLFAPLLCSLAFFLYPGESLLVFFLFFLSFFLSFFWAVLCAERGTYSEQETSDEGSQHRCGRWVGVSNPYPHLTPVPPAYKTTKTLDFNSCSRTNGSTDRLTEQRTDELTDGLSLV